MRTKIQVKKTNSVKNDVLNLLAIVRERYETYKDAEWTERWNNDAIEFAFTVKQICDRTSWSQNAVRRVLGDLQISDRVSTRSARRGKSYYLLTEKETRKIKERAQKREQDKDEYNSLKTMFRVAVGRLQSETLYGSVSVRTEGLINLIAAAKESGAVNDEMLREWFGCPNDSDISDLG